MKRTPGGARIKTVIDPAKLEEALTLMREAASMKRIDGYQLAMQKERIPLLPPRTDSLDQLIPITYAAGLTTANFSFRYISDAVAAKAIQLAGDKDVEGFKRLLEDWEAFTKLHAQNKQGSLVDVLLAVATTQAPLKALAEAATDLGIPEEAARLKALDERFEARKSVAKSPNRPNDEIAMHSSILVGLSVPVVSRQSIHSPVLTDADLKPGRLADHAALARVMSLVGWIVLGLAALAAGLYRFRCGALPKRLSRALVPLLRPVDWLWIFGAGIILPIIYYVVVTRFTPMGGREWSLKATVFAAPAGQFTAMLWLMIALPLVMIRYRLTVRGGVAGLTGHRQLFGWTAVTCGFLAIPCFGMTFRSGSPSEKVLTGAAILLGVVQIYTLVAGIRSLFSGRTSLLRRATISRALLPSYVAGMTMLLAALLIFHEEEKHWISQERLMEITVDAPSMGRFEYQATQGLSRELQEMLEESE